MITCMLSGDGGRQKKRQHAAGLIPEARVLRKFKVQRGSVFWASEIFSLTLQGWLNLISVLSKV